MSTSRSTHSQLRFLVPVARLPTDGTSRNGLPTVDYFPMRAEFNFWQSISVSVAFAMNSCSENGQPLKLLGCLIRVGCSLVCSGPV